MLNVQGGELVAVLRGANAPFLQRMIVEELAKEKSVLEQGGERQVVSLKIHTFTLLLLKTKMAQLYLSVSVSYDSVVAYTTPEP